MDTVLQKIQDFNARGYTIDYNSPRAKEYLSKNTNQYRIDEIYRYEGLSDPEDEAIICAISSIDRTQKGILVSGYGVYVDETIASLIQRIEKL